MVSGGEGVVVGMRLSVVEVEEEPVVVGGTYIDVEVVGLQHQLGLD